MSDLSTTQRIAVRAIADQKGRCGAPTLRSLERRGLIAPSGIKSPLPTDARAWKLTRKGRNAHKKIMASGDGPETLKGMLSIDAVRKEL
jgi:hypothetical protein